ncbi:ankyrin repeat domain-containing protein [Nocardia vermiculata]|nr:ankyrin repeat domain-containing protein [Nocardia vermiculata]
MSNTPRRRSMVAATALAVLALGVVACQTDRPDDRRPATGTTAPARTDNLGAAPAPTTAAPDPTLDAALVAAAADNDEQRVRELITRGANIEARGEQDRTPLVAATKARATAAARALIEAGADVNAKDALQDSAYLYAGAEGIDDILELTLTHGADIHSVNRYGGTALIPASEHGHITTVRRLIEAGVDVDHINTPRWTALHEAIVYGDGSQRYQQVVTTLLDAGADPAIRDGSGRTALDNAERLGQTAVAAILRDRAQR